jgi:hypothetical protein
MMVRPSGIRGLVDDTDDVTFGRLSDASRLNKFQIADGVIINAAKINRVARRCKASHIRAGYTSIGTAINEGSPVVMLSTSTMNVECLVVVPSGGQTIQGRPVVPLSFGVS